MLIAAPRANGDGWDIWGRMDIESDPLYQEEANLDFAFVYIPYSADRLIGVMFEAPMERYCRARAPIP